MTEKEVRSKIKKAGGNWRTFKKWMVGQTMGMNKDGSVDYYECDVDRFIEYKCNPRNEPLQAWD